MTRKKKKSTYKPKWTKQSIFSKKSKAGHWSKLLMPMEKSEKEKVVVSEEKLPQDYNPPDNMAYTFPPFIVVGIIILVIAIIAALLY